MNTRIIKTLISAPKGWQTVDLNHAITTVREGVNNNTFKDIVSRISEGRLPRQHTKHKLFAKQMERTLKIYEKINVFTPETETGPESPGVLVDACKQRIFARGFLTGILYGRLSLIIDQHLLDYEASKMVWVTINTTAPTCPVTAELYDPRDTETIPLWITINYGDYHA